MPDTVVQAAQGLAQELGTTTNDAIVRLAEEGIATRQRRRLVERIAQERRETVMEASFVDATSFPPPEELRTAMLSGRRDS